MRVTWFRRRPQSGQACQDLHAQFAVAVAVEGPAVENFIFFLHGMVLAKVGGYALGPGDALFLNCG